MKAALAISFVSLFLHLLLLTFFNPEKEKKKGRSDSNSNCDGTDFTFVDLLEYDLGSVDSQQQGPGFESLPASPRVSVGSLSV